MSGTRVEARVVRVVDGDTLRIESDGREESLRILALDTEESNAGGTKPVTRLGHAAKDRASQVFAPGDLVTLEFPGPEPAEEAWRKYRDNYGRALVFVYDSSGRDFQELMIGEGYSPYFTKYGYAEFADHHRRYQDAERTAQAAHLGVWDQLTVNGHEARNYAALGVWWDLRARLVEEFRSFRRAHPETLVFDARLDYDELTRRAAATEEATVFTELRELRRVGGGHAVILIGSIEQPFKVFLPDILDRQPIVRLLENRYIAVGETHPRRNYAYVTGPIKLFRGEPEIVVTDAVQIRDEPPL